MIRFNRQILVLPLVACLLLVPALASPAMVAHEAQHAHHKAATHATALCSWLCTAADAVEGTVVDVAPVRYSAFLEQVSPITRLHLSHGSQPPSRAPPFA